MAREPAAHSRIHDHFVEQIQQGEYRGGKRMPTESEIAEQFGVSRATVQFAMSRLAWEGWVDRFPGRGTFASAQRSLRVVESPERGARGWKDEGLASVSNDDEQDTDTIAGKWKYAILHMGPSHDPGSLTLSSSLLGRRHDIDKPGWYTATHLFNANSFADIPELSRVCIVEDKIVGLERHFFMPGMKLNYTMDDITKVHAHQLLTSEYLGINITRVEARIISMEEYEEEDMTLDDAEKMIYIDEQRSDERRQLVVYSERLSFGPLEAWYISKSGRRSSSSGRSAVDRYETA